MRHDGGIPLRSATMQNPGARILERPHLNRARRDGIEVIWIHRLARCSNTCELGLDKTPELGCTTPLPSEHHVTIL